MDSLLLVCSVLPAGAQPLWNRVLPGAEGASTGGMSTLNLVFVIAFAVAITFLAQWLARRGGRRK